ncbi:MAG TPA: undecaprenyl-phosphate glucose phosphotransferase [Gammaproteobacteria bacterium]|nr:undecaprenyl-phosphate glucose phosphotransferase [Gammaproteobacteria bacterium]
MSAALYAVVDLAMVVVGAWAAYVWRFGTLDMDVHYRAPVFIAILLAAIIFPALGLYDSWRGRSALDQVRAMTWAWGTTVLGLVLIGFMLKQSESYSRLWLGSWAVLSWLLLSLGRTGASLTLRWLRLRGWNRRRIFIIGAGPVAQDVARRVYANPTSGWEIVAAASTESADTEGLRGVRIVRYRRNMERLIRRLQVDEVWLCLPLNEQALIEKALWDLRHCTATLRLVPNLQGLRLIQHPLAEVLGMPMLNLSVSPMQGVNRLIKAAEDRVLAALILLCMSPLFVILAIGVKRSSPGPVFFRQRRVGWNGKAFTMFKFRSMPIDAEADTGPTWACKDEARATRFGRFIRRTSLDELPQFINVLAGHMSIVGPRPERPVFVEKFKDQIPDYMRKHLVKAGITGWAQVHGWRGNTDLKKRIEFDLYYIENWSLWFDLKIIFLTVFKGFVNKNAY